MTDDDPANGSALEPIKSAGEDIAAGTIGALLGTAVAGPVGTGIGIVAGPAMIAAAKATRIAIGKRANNRARVISEAANRSRITMDDLIAKAELSPPHAELLARILDAAGESVLPGKLEALAQVLADGIDTDELDYPLALANALADLEAPAVRVLKRISEDGIRPKHEEPAPHTGAIGTKTDRLQIELPADRLLIPSAIRLLDLHGLIRDVAVGAHLGPAGGGNRWVLSDLGVAVLELLGVENIPQPPGGPAPVDQ